jgi:23S rRNA (uridine2552-2'-O)-methyltransferase
MKSSEWLREHATDPFVRRAKAEGWRSRAVFKLKEIDERDRLLKPGQVCVDLGAAPGAWSQYAARKVGRSGRVVATDLLPLEPLPGVDFVLGDFREEAVANAVLERLAGGTADIVLSDMAPNLSGIDSVDQPRSMYLAELALDLAGRVLKPRGSALIKVFQGQGFRELVGEARGRFAEVRLVKPGASRARSPEIYLLAKHRLLV